MLWNRLTLDVRQDYGMSCIGTFFFFWKSELTYSYRHQALGIDACNLHYIAVSQTVQYKPCISVQSSPAVISDPRR